MKPGVNLIFLLVLAFANGDASHRDKRQAKTTTTKAPVCNRMNFDSLKSCCQGNVGAFFQVSEIQGCAKGTVDPKMQKFATYQLHTLYDAKNQLNLSSPANLKAMGQVPCIVECLFIKKGLLNSTTNQTILNATVAHFIKAATANWVAAGAASVNSTTNATLMAEIVEQCINATSSFSPSSMDVAIVVKNVKSTQNCLTQPALLLQCIRQTVAEACPPKLYNAKSAACTTGMKNLDKCGFFNTTVTFKK